MAWVWSLFACTSGRSVVDTLSTSFQPGIVLPEQAMVLGTDGQQGTIDGWIVSGDSVRQCAPKGPGGIVAASAWENGVLVVAAQTNGSDPQLWAWDGSSWTAGRTIPHGPIHQLLVTPDGTLWTEGDAGVHRSANMGEEWKRMDVPSNLRLGSVKLGHAEGRVVFAGNRLLMTRNQGQIWSVLYDGSVSTTDGRWVAANTDKPSLRIGRIDADGLTWTGEVDGQWNAAAIRGYSDGVRLVATKVLSTDAVVLEGNTQGSEFKRTQLNGPASSVGLGEGLMWVDDKHRLHRSR